MYWRLALWIWSSFVLLQYLDYGKHYCLGCLEQERVALLDFKHSVTWTNSGPLLASWFEGDKSDCCKWERVQCDPITGRVSELSLIVVRGELSGTDSMKFPWYINVSKFLPFEQLEHLDLSHNMISGWSENEGFERLSSLKNLQRLELSGNQFNNSILTPLSTLKSLYQLCLNQVSLLNGPYLSQGFESLSTLKGLEHLYLDNNLLGNTVLSHLASFTSLRILSLRFNNLNSSALSQGSGLLSGFKKLEVLFLGNNDFNSSILPTLGLFTSLKELYLEYNHFDGPLPFGSDIWSGLKNLENLTLTSTNFNKEFLPSLGGLTSLKSLDLSNNSLNGFFSPGLEMLSGLKKLEMLDLSTNGINNSMLPAWSDLGSLKSLYLGLNHLSGPFPQGLCGLKNLQDLVLKMNSLNGAFPTCLANLTILQTLDLSSNLFTGSIPPSTLNNLMSLEYISLSNSNFQGASPLFTLANHSKLKEIHLENCSGTLEARIEHQNILPKFQLEILSLTDFSFKKPVDIALSFLYNQYNLREVSLIRTNLTGDFPAWLIENNKNLQKLNLAENSLAGFHLPNYSYPSLNLIDISMNNFHGHIQANLGQVLPYLMYLNLSRNNFEDNIPPSIGYMRHLRLLDLSSNNFSGKVPENLAAGCAALEVLKLSNNSLSGQIFSNNFNLQFLQVLYLDKNNFSGIIPN